MSSNLREALNEGNLNRVDAMLQAARLGDVAANTTRQILNQTVTGAGTRIALAEDRKAIAVVAGFDITNGVLLTPAPIGSAVGAAGISVHPNGDISFHGADNIAAADVLYVSPDAEVEEFAVVAVVASVATIPQTKRAWVLTVVEILTGIDVQVINGAGIAIRGSAPADNTVALNAAGTGVVFNAGDVVTGTCRIRALVARTGLDLSTKLARASGF